MGRKARATANKRAATALQHSRIPGAAAPASPPVLPFLAQACLPLLKSKILALQPHIADLSGDNTSCPITRNLLSDLIAGCIRIGLSDRGLAASAALISLSRGLAHERVSIAAKLSERYHLNQDVNIADPIIVGEVQSWWGDSGNREYVLIDSDEFKDVWGSVTADQGMHKRIRINYKVRRSATAEICRTDSNLAGHDSPH